MFVHIEGEANRGLQGLIKLGQNSDFQKAVLAEAVKILWMHK